MAGGSAVEWVYKSSGNFAELAVFLKGYQNRCGEVRQGSLVASEFTFQTSPTAVRFEQPPRGGVCSGSRFGRASETRWCHSSVGWLTAWSGLLWESSPRPGFRGTTWRDFISHFSWEGLMIQLWELTWERSVAAFKTLCSALLWRTMDIWTNTLCQHKAQGPSVWIAPTVVRT